jgi:hypothetical protein
MSEAEAIMTIIGLLLAVFGLAYAVRTWPHDPTNDEDWL